MDQQEVAAIAQQRRTNRILARADRFAKGYGAIKQLVSIARHENEAFTNSFAALTVFQHANPGKRRIYSEHFVIAENLCGLVFTWRNHEL